MLISIKISLLHCLGVCHETAFSLGLEIYVAKLGLERKLDQYGTPFSTESILKTLRNMNVINNQDAFYTATFKGSQICTSLNDLFDLGLDKKYYLPQELNKKIKKIST